MDIELPREKQRSTSREKPIVTTLRVFLRARSVVRTVLVTRCVIRACISRLPDGHGKSSGWCGGAKRGSGSGRWSGRRSKRELRDLAGALPLYEGWASNQPTAGE